MSIQSEITRISGNVSDALAAVAAKGVAVSEDANSDDLATLIGEIANLPSGGSAGQVIIKQSATDGDVAWGSLVTDFEVTLAAANWTDFELTVSDARFLAAGYKFDVGPAPDCIEDYVSAGVYANDVTVDGQMTFNCEYYPDSSLTVYIARLATA